VIKEIKVNLKNLLSTFENVYYAIILFNFKVMGSREARKSLGRIAVMTEQEIRSFPVQRCDRATSCQECVALQDPFCAWDIRSSR